MDLSYFLGLFILNTKVLKVNVYYNLVFSNSFLKLSTNFLTFSLEFKG